jgi:hypothetical protein
MRQALSGGRLRSFLSMFHVKPIAPGGTPPLESGTAVGRRLFVAEGLLWWEGRRR